jgi:hypothetical protein
MKEENVPAGWMTPAQNASAARVPREVSRDIVRRLTARLGVQGLAVVTVGADSYTVSLRLLAAGSGEPDVLTMSLSDAASQGRVVERLSVTLPALVQPSLDASLVDVAGTQGAVVVRANAASGLAVDDVVTAAAGRPVTSVADLQAALTAHNFGTPAIALDVTGAGAASRKVASGVAKSVDTLPVRDPALLANRALLELQDAARTAGPGVDQAAVSINLALVHMRLGNWDDALAVLKDVQTPAGPGVSAGTVAYLNGLAFESLGRTADAQAAFSSAAAAPLARLWFQGPLVAPLARARLQSRR